MPKDKMKKKIFYILVEDINKIILGTKPEYPMGYTETIMALDKAINNYLLEFGKKYVIPKKTAK